MLRWAVLVGLLVLLAGCTRQAGSHSQAPTTLAKPTIAWTADPAVGFKQAKASGKPIMMDVMASWCEACKRLDREVWSRQDVGDVAKSYVAIHADGDKYPDIPKKYRVSGYPTTIFLTSEGKEVDRIRGAAPYEDVLATMKGALNKATRTK